MADRDKALEDYKAGLSYKEIAKKHGTFESTVKSWASRYWNKDKKIKAARNRAKKLQPKTKKGCNLFDDKNSHKVAIEKRRKGAQPGNINALGHGAPIGNMNSKGHQNALKHGGYSTIYWDTLDDEERAMINDVDTDEEHQLEEQLKLFIVRERRILKAIHILKSKENETGNVEMSSSVFFTAESKNKPAGSRKDYIKSEFAIVRLEKELTGVQRSKTRVINSLVELRRLKGNNNDDWLDDFFSVIDEVTDEKS